MIQQHCQNEAGGKAPEMRCIVNTFIYQALHDHQQDHHAKSSHIAASESFPVSQRKV